MRAQWSLESKSFLQACERNRVNRLFYTAVDDRSDPQDRGFIKETTFEWPVCVNTCHKKIANPASYRRENRSGVRRHAVIINENDNNPRDFLAECLHCRVRCFFFVLLLQFFAIYIYVGIHI